MKCFPELTYAIFADGELPAEEARLVEMHLAACARCRALVDGLRAENRLLAALLQETEEAPVPAASGAMRVLNILWTAVILLAGAAGLQAALRWLAALRPPEPLDWLSLFDRAVQLDLFFRGLFYFLEEGAAMLVSSITTLSALALGVLVVAGALLLLLRRSAAVSLLVCLALTLGLAQPASALEVRSGRTVTIPGGQTLDDTLVAFAETVNIEGTVTGDLIAFSQRVAMRGKVKGDVVCFARTLNLDGNAEGNVYSFTQLLNLRGQVARSFHGFAQRVELDSPAHVGTDLIAFASEVALDGAVGRDAMAFAESTEVRGNIGRNLTARTRRMTLLASARVDGNLTAFVPRARDFHMDSGATVAGKKEIRLRPPRPSRYLQPRFYFWQAVRLVAAFLTGLLLCWLFPFLFAARLDTPRAALMGMGVGFLVLVATPVAAVLAGITLVGLPIALLGLAAWVAGLYLGKVFVAPLVGQALLRLPAGSGAPPAHVLLLGLAILFVAINLPYVGGGIHFLVTLLGLGAMVFQLRSHWQRA